MLTSEHEFGDASGSWATPFPFISLSLNLASYGVYRLPCDVSAMILPSSETVEFPGGERTAKKKKITKIS
jgi:hypothetical protein